MTLAHGDTVISGTIAAVDAAHVTAGAAVTFASDDGTLSGSGVVQNVAAHGGQSTFTVAPRTTLPPTLRGADVRLTVATGTTVGKVLVVPVSAIRGTASSPTVIVSGADGTRREVPVQVGISAQGLVEVRAAVFQRPLAVGDAVLVSE